MQAYPYVVYRSTVVGAWILAAFGFTAAWVWSATRQCDESPTPEGVKLALGASVLSICLGLIAAVLPLSKAGFRWRVGSGLAVIAGVVALYFALGAMPSGSCG